MRLSKEDEKLFARISEVLERSQSTGTISTDDFSAEDLRNMLASEIPDIAIAGSYLLSLLPDDMDLSLLNENPASAKNYARFLIGELPLEDSIKILDKKNLPTVMTNLRALNSRRVKTPAVTTAAPLVDEMTILIHGTWSTANTWWQKGSIFWDYINNITKNVYAGDNPFSWSGSNKHPARVQAAHELIAWAKNNPCTHLDIIAHSHGGNVCFIRNNRVSP